MIGLLRMRGDGLAEVFNGQGYAPEPLSDAELAHDGSAEGVAALDLPDWIWPEWERSLGDAAAEVAEAMRARAPVYIRTNIQRISRQDLMRQLETEGILTRPHSLTPWALEANDGARKLQASGAFADGLFEFQDAASQAVVASIATLNDLTILDYCAGGGGKSLALAAASAGPVDAHDANPARMRQLPERARRAGASVNVVSDPAPGHYDLVLADAPCSGSGSWRRDPAGKWRLDETGLAQLVETQNLVLQQAASHVRPGGRMVYATCSVLMCENEDRVAEFLRAHAGWQAETQLRFSPVDGPDGFFAAHLLRGQ